MIYTEQTKKAMLLCYQAHAGQLDKGGIPYVFHPYHLAEQMDDEHSTVTALLHDVVEDTQYTFEDLEAMEFAPEVIRTLKLLTHERGVPYLDYVKRLSADPIARKVKIADLTHNMDQSRMPEGKNVNQERTHRYRTALSFLLERN